uniref:Uncharacterized protein n=1 Tax=Trichuris muris TaxID=70415 RepID=A0A5S6QFP4_TRIMR
MSLHQIDYRKRKWRNLCRKILAVHTLPLRSQRRPRRRNLNKVPKILSNVSYWHEKTSSAGVSFENGHWRWPKSRISNDVNSKAKDHSTMSSSFDRQGQQAGQAGAATKSKEYTD